MALAFARGLGLCLGLGHALHRDLALPTALALALALALAWHGMLAEAVACLAASQGRGVACSPSPWHAVLAQPVARHVGPRHWHGMPAKACWPTLRHGVLDKAVPWHGMLTKTVPWHAGRGRGMACWPRPWLAMPPRPWHAGQRTGMACWPWRWHDMLAKAVAWHVGQG